VGFALRARWAAAILGATMLLTACQGPPVPADEDGACEPTIAGSASDAITVTGSRDEQPNVGFDSLDEVRTTQRTVVREGRGRIAERGTLATFSYAAYSASSGELIDAVGYDGHHVQATVDDATLLPGMKKTILCSRAGSRLVGVIPPEDGFGVGTSAPAGVSPSESIVVVVDLVAVAADRANGEPQDVDDETLPAVTVGASGEPRVSIPPKAPPKELVTRVLKMGSGELVTEGAKVTVEYVGVDWKTSRIFDTSWNKAALVQRPTTDFIKGFGSALTGARVGSQLLVVVPPGLGYDAAGNTQFGLEPSDTLVFVIDILAVVQPPGEVQ